LLNKLIIIFSFEINLTHLNENIVNVMTNKLPMTPVKIQKREFCPSAVELDKNI